MTSDERTIYQRIADAYRDIAAAGFTKSGTVKVGTKDSYNFIPIGQILQAVREAHAANGVFTVFGRPEYDVEQGEKRITVEKVSSYDGKKSTWTVANGHIDVTIYGAGGDSISMTVPCEAQDNSDKLTNKLITNAERCLYRTLYAIDEGDATDPEAVNTVLSDDPADRAREQAKADSFFGKESTPEQRQEQAVVEAMGDDAQFVDATAIAEAAKARREAVDVGNARAMLAQLRRSDPQNEILSAYIQKYGGLSQLKDPQVIDCFLDLQDAGVVE